MGFELRSVDKTRLSTSIAEQLGEAIRSGGYPPGSALPAERILAEKLNVSRGSVREAIRILEHIGLLDVRTGSGTFVRPDAPPAVSLLRLRAASVGEHSPLDVMTARRAIEPVCAELAARDRTEHDLAALRAAITEHGRLLDQAADPQDTDLLFHRAVAAASHNPVLELLVDRLVEIMDQGTWRDLKTRLRASRSAAALPLAQHMLVLEAIERQDATAAAAAMTEHLSWFEESVLVGVDG